MADDADIIPGSYILQYGYHFGVVIIKLVFGPSFFSVCVAFVRRMSPLVVNVAHCPGTISFSRGEAALPTFTRP